MASKLPQIRVNPHLLNVWETIGGACVSRSFVDNDPIRFFPDVGAAREWVADVRARKLTRVRLDKRAAAHAGRQNKGA